MKLGNNIGGSKVKILNGRFSGKVGKVSHVEIWDNAMPVYVTMVDEEKVFLFPDEVEVLDAK